MTIKPLYVLDANVFIEASRRYYAFDFAPVFWDALVESALSGHIHTIDHVKTELEMGKDELKEWITCDFCDWCAPTTDENVINLYKEIMTWVYQNVHFSEEAKSSFASGADGWLIAYAKVYECEIVTQERFNPDIKNRIPIPNVCKEFKVQYIDTFEMLRRLGVRFQWRAEIDTAG